MMNGADGVYHRSGALRSCPEQMKFGTIKVLGFVIPFLYAGAMVSKKAAAFLEENDIFVPDDYDD